MDSMSRRPSLEPSSLSICAVAYYDEWQVRVAIDAVTLSCRHAAH